MNMWIGWAWRISHLKNMKQLISTKWHECVDEILHRLHQPIGNINCSHLSFHQMQRFNCMSTQIEWKNPLKTRAIQPINQLVDALRSVTDICSNLKTNWRQFSFHYCNTIPAIDQSLHLPSKSIDRIKLQSNFNSFKATRIECNFQHCPSVEWIEFTVVNASFPISFSHFVCIVCVCRKMDLRAKQYRSSKTNRTKQAFLFLI